MILKLKKEQPNILKTEKQVVKELWFQRFEQLQAKKPKEMKFRNFNDCAKYFNCFVDEYKSYCIEHQSRGLKF